MDYLLSRKKGYKTRAPNKLQVHGTMGVGRERKESEREKEKE